MRHVYKHATVDLLILKVKKAKRIGDITLTSLYKLTSLKIVLAVTFTG